MDGEGATPRARAALVSFRRREYDGIGQEAGWMSGMARGAAVVVGLAMVLGCAGLGKGEKDDTGSGGTDDSGGDSGESGGDSGGTGPSVIDVLLVLDNSDSMQPVAERLAAADLPAALAGLDWQLGVTTTSVDTSAGPTNGVDPGELGTLTGEGVVDGGASDAEDQVRRALFCGATCWSETDLPSDPSFSCGDPVGAPDGAVSRQYLDCLCGRNAWTDQCGSGVEMPLEASAMAVCRSLASPPDDCFGYENPSSGSAASTALDERDDYPTHTLLRDGAALVVLIVSDEGDGSYRIATGDDDPGVYADLYAALGVDPWVSVLGPNDVGGELECNSTGAQVWGVERFVSLVAMTGGAYAPLEEEDGGTCDATDPREWLDAAVAALAGR